VLRDEPRRPVLQERRQVECEVQYAGELALGAVGMDLPALPQWKLRTVARLRDFCRFDLLRPHHYWPFCPSPHPAGYPATVPGIWLSCASGAIYRHGVVDLWCTVAIQTSVHMAGADPRAAGSAGVLVADAKDGCRNWQPDVNRKNLQGR